MPTYTSRLGLPLPLGTEFHNLENYKSLINTIDAKASSKAEFDAHTANKSNPHGVTAAQVGLGNVLNVAQYSKTQTDSLINGIKNALNLGQYTKSVTDSINTYPTGTSVTFVRTNEGWAGFGTVITFKGTDAGGGSLQIYAPYNTETGEYGGKFVKFRTTLYVGSAPDGMPWGPWKDVATTDGNVATATKLQTVRTIAGVSFDGTSNISIPAGNVGAYTKAEVDSRIATTVGGNVASATKLQTARTINGVAFDGTANIEVLAQQKTETIPPDADLDTYKTVGNYACSSNATAATLKNCPTVNAFTLQVLSNANSASGSILTQILHEYMAYAGAKTYIRRGYMSQWSNWYAIGVADGSLQSGLYAQTASRLATARAITLTGGVTGSATFDGTATASIATTIVGNAPTATTATKLATARTISLTGGVTGSTTFDGSGNVSIAATIAGNAPSATKLATARTINGTAFDGTSNITVTADPNQKQIPANTNLDTLIEPGFWTSHSDGNAATLTNTPFGSSTFTLHVETGNNNARVIQTAKRAINGDVAVRYKYDNQAFSAWVTLARKDGNIQNGLIAEKAGSLQSSRTIALSGAVTGSVAFDGSGNATIATSPGSTVVNTTSAQSIGGTKEFTSVPTSGGVPLARMTNVALPMKGLLSGTIDWDSLTEIGLYYANGITNKPNLCSNYGHLEVISQINTANVTQRYTDINGTTIQRSYVGGGAGWTAWKLVAYDSGWQSLAYTSPFTHFNSSTIDVPKIRRVNNQVYITGVATVTRELPTNTEAIMMLSAPMPSWARSDNTVYGVQQGTGQRSWLLTAYTSGNLGLSRYGLTTGESVQAGHWLPYNMTWFVTYDPGI